MLDDETRAEIARLTEEVSRLADVSRRAPSKAHLIGQGPADPYAARDGGAFFFATLARANSIKLAGGIEGQLAAKADLEAMGSYWSDMPPGSKAVVGDTDIAGGYLVPNAVVADIVEQSQERRAVVDLFTTVSGLNAAAIDLPWESAVDARAVIVAPGVTKENSNFQVNNYAATFYTMARIFDIGNQLLRNSGGAAEQIVRSKLANAMVRGENHYVINGTGTGEPTGLLTALTAAGNYDTTFSSPADNTIAGSVAAAIATAAGDLEDRGAEATGVAMNTRDWWRMRRQGTDTAGFFVDPANPSGTRSLSIFGLPVRPSTAIPSDTLIVGDFKGVTFYRGLGYRVDTSSEAGDRWDKNLTGFRAEQEIAFNALPSVFTGHFQRITNAVGS